MGYSTKLSDAIHILSYIELFKGGNTSSQAISQSIKTNPVVVRRLMAKLKKANLIHSSKGKANPTLSRSPSKITFYDIYHAVEDVPIVFHTNPGTNTECPAGAVIQEVLDTHYQTLQKNLEKDLAQHYLSEVIGQIKYLGDFSK